MYGSVILAMVLDSSELVVHQDDVMKLVVLFYVSNVFDLSPLIRHLGSGRGMLMTRVQPFQQITHLHLNVT